MKTSAEQLLELDRMASAISESFGLSRDEVFSVMIKTVIGLDKVA
jgi:hypothetical protein